MIAFRHSYSAKTPRGAGRQRGSFLLEALISVLIVALGILGLIGLQARAFQNIDDAQYRAEAAYMANALLGQMWVYDRTKLIADFDSGGGGVAYTEFKAWVGQRLPGANIPANAQVPAMRVIGVNEIFGGVVRHAIPEEAEFAVT